MLYEQLSFFPIDSKLDNNKIKHQQIPTSTNISEQIANEFDIMPVPFLGCDFDTVYPKVKRLLPKESILFNSFGLENAIICEIICAAICHQINWDFLRKHVYEKTSISSEWLLFDNLETISESEVYEMLCTYDKPERIRVSERTKIIKEIGEWANRFKNIRNVFWKNDKELLDYEVIHKNILLCPVFGGDPQEKKLQLLLQKLSDFPLLDGLLAYCRPAVDYHLIRNYLRRGLIYSKTKHAKTYIEDNLSERKERTVAAIRMLCSNLLEEISIYTDLNINSINLIEWHIGRSVCTKKADCRLELSESNWLKPIFNECPFYNTCMARLYNHDYLKIQEPNYNGTSY